MNTAFDPGIMLSGFAFWLSLIVAIGAQNAFVLRQGVARSHVALTFGVCALSDFVLLALAVGGMGVVMQQAPVAMDVLRWVGVAFLVGYAAFALRRVFVNRSMEATGAASTSMVRVVIAALAFTWLNPQVYLDSMLIFGSVAATHGDTGRWTFAAGAALASVVWFGLISWGAGALSKLFSRPVAWKVLDAVTAAVMLAIAVRLVVTA